MPGISLTEQLATLLQDHDRRAHEAARKLESLHIEQQEIAHQIAVLEARLKEIAGAAGELERQASECAADLARQEREVALACLAAGQQALRAATPYLRERAHARDARMTMLSRDPQLSMKVEAYRAFVEQPPTALHSLPAWHQQALLEAQARLAQELQPYLQLEEQETRPYETAINLPVLVVRDVTNLQVHWIFPCTGKVLDRRAPDRDKSLVDTLFATLAGLRDLPDWDVGETTAGSWAGWLAIQQLVEYGGTIPFEDAAREALQTGLSASPYFAGIRLILEVAQLSERALNAEPYTQRSNHAPSNENVAVARPLEPPVQNVQSTPLLEPPTGPAPETQSTVPQTSLPAMAAPAISLPDTQKLTEPSTHPALGPELPEAPRRGALTDFSEGLFTTADVAAWERTAKDDSQWQTRERRLRTVLIRLVAEGWIGARGISLDRLSHSLPEPHRTELDSDLQQLLHAELLTSVSDARGDSPLVALNPRVIDEVQNLINREVTPFWAKILGRAVATQEE